MDKHQPISARDLVVRTYPDAVLRSKAQPVDVSRSDTQAVVERMFELMYAEEGIGLAAPQVGLAWRLFVVDVPESTREPVRSASPEHGLPSATRGRMVYINPVISEPGGPLAKSEEGCLSLPDIRGDVLRPRDVTITAMGLDGKPFSQRATGLLARCWQHEFDHLEGVLIIDRFTQLSRIKTRSALRDLERR